MEKTDYLWQPSVHFELGKQLLGVMGEALDTVSEDRAAGRRTMVEATLLDLMAGREDDFRTVALLSEFIDELQESLPAPHAAFTNGQKMITDYLAGRGVDVASIKPLPEEIYELDNGAPRQLRLDVQRVYYKSMGDIGDYMLNSHAPSRLGYDENDPALAGENLRHWRIFDTWAHSFANGLQQAERHLQQQDARGPYPLRISFAANIYLAYPQYDKRLLIVGMEPDEYEKIFSPFHADMVRAIEKIYDFLDTSAAPLAPYFYLGIDPESRHLLPPVRASVVKPASLPDYVP